MRIISGRFKGKQLNAPRNLPVRPTTDFAKTALFNILQHRFIISEISVVDLFAGTGAISLELASRGCTDITAVDKSRNCTTFIQSVAKDWNIQGLKVTKDDVFRFLKTCKYKVDLIFADPPYALEGLREIPSLVFQQTLLRPKGLLIVEHGADTDFSAEPHFEEHRVYGHVNFSLFSLDS